MSDDWRCPTCGGTGRVPVGPGDPEWGTGADSKLCPSCGGSGAKSG
jgi:DnaJ-class molecular chaperone